MSAKVIYPVKVCWEKKKKKKKANDDSMLSWIPCRFLKLDFAPHTNFAEGFIDSTVDNFESCRDYFTFFYLGG